MYCFFAALGASWELLGSPRGSFFFEPLGSFREDWGRFSNDFGWVVKAFEGILEILVIDVVFDVV